MYPFSQRERGGDAARTRAWNACRLVRARAALLSGTALVRAAFGVSLAVVRPPPLADDATTKTQLDAAITGGATTINILPGVTGLTLRGAQPFNPAVDLPIGAGSSLSTAGATNNQVL